MAAVKLKNLARMTTATTGTGTITLGSATPGFLSFAGAGVSDGDVVRYAINDGANSEFGYGVYTASGTTLTRNVETSTNSNNPISLSGNAQVVITPSAQDFPFVVDSGGASISFTGGSVGIGTATPNKMLEVGSSTASDGIRVSNSSALGSASGGTVQFVSTLTPSAANQRLGHVSFGGVTTGTTFDLSAAVGGWSAEAWDTTHAGSYLTFETTAAGGSTTRTQRMAIFSDGGVNVGSSTTSPGAGVVNIAATTTSNSTTSGALVVGGGVGVGGSIYTNGSVKMLSPQAGNLIVGGSAVDAFNATATIYWDPNNYSCLALHALSNGTVGPVLSIYNGAGTFAFSWSFASSAQTTLNMNGSYSLTSSVASSSTTTGTLVIAGGVGVGGAGYFGGEVSAAAASGYLLGSVQFVKLNTNYHQLYDPAGNITISLGNATDPTNYYDNTNHIWRTRAAAATVMTLASGLQVGAPTAGDKGTGTVNTASGYYHNGVVVGNSTINTQTASYTAVLADAGAIIEMNVGSANNLTVPPNSSVAYPIGTFMNLVQYGAGQTTVVAGSGVTIRTMTGLKVSGQYGGVFIYKRGTDEWVAIGNLTT